MILVQLDRAIRDELQSVRRQASPPRARDRLEMVLLSSMAWSPVRIATHLGCCAPTVHNVLKDFLNRGIAVLFPRRTEPPPDLRRREQGFYSRSPPVRNSNESRSLRNSVPTPPHWSDLPDGHKHKTTYIEITLSDASESSARLGSETARTLRWLVTGFVWDTLEGIFDR